MYSCGSNVAFRVQMDINHTKSYTQKIFCIGDSTTELLNHYGFTALNSSKRKKFANVNFTITLT